MTTTTAPLRRPTAFVPFRTPVRGHVFAAKPPTAQAPIPGQRVVLAREPHNPVDPLAIAVWLDPDGAPWRIGYLAREVAARLAPRLDDGARLEARVDGWVHEPEQRWQRPVLAVFPVPHRYTPDDRPGTASVARESAPPGPARVQGGAAIAPTESILPGRPARSVRRRVGARRSR